jgi:hypothetical protein
VAGLSSAARVQQGQTKAKSIVKALGRVMLTPFRLYFLFNCLLIKTHHDLAVDDDHRHGHPTRKLNHLLPGLCVLGNVSFLIRNPLLRKELLRVVTMGSRRGGKDLYVHVPLLFLRLFYLLFYLLGHPSAQFLTALEGVPIGDKLYL